MPSVTVVIPALNEELAIEDTIQKIPREDLESSGFPTEVLVVDNGSTDKTAEYATGAGARVIAQPNRGYGWALWTGFVNAEGDIIVTIDADMTYPADMIPDLVNTLVEKDLDFLTTNRFAQMESGAMNWRNQFGNRVLSLAARVLFQIPFVDSQSGMWVFRRAILEKIKLRSRGMPLSEEIKIEAAYFAKLRCIEVPIPYARRQGPVKLRAWRDGMENLLYLFYKRVRR